MLGGKNFGGRHECDLIAVLDGNDGRFEGDDRFAGANVPLQ